MVDFRIERQGVSKKEVSERRLEEIAASASKELQDEYPDVEIRFDKSLKLGKIPMNIFTVKYPGIIISDGVQESPGTTVVIKRWSLQKLKTEVKKILENYKESS